jgi:osmoprotectant transport system permease protein
MRRWGLLIVALGVIAVVPLRWSSQRASVRIGSKKFTESVLLGEMLTHLVRTHELSAEHVSELGGTRLVYNTLKKGEIDVYPEYTGTIRQEILASEDLPDDDLLAAALRKQGILMSRSLGFNNTYAIAVRREVAEGLGLRKISDLARHPQLRLGFGEEFMERGDGWPSLRTTYGLVNHQVTPMDHDLAYGQIAAGAIDVMDAYATDARLKILDLVVLQDDRHHFPAYEAVLLYRADLAERSPAAVRAIEQMENLIDEESMLQLNVRAEGESNQESRIAADFLAKKLGIVVQVDAPTLWEEVGARTIEHLDLVRRSLIPAIFVAVPLGVVAAKFPRLGQILLGMVGIVQTIPALALLVLMIAPAAWLGLPTVGTGSVTAIAALFLYSLLPIVRNTTAGLTGIPAELKTSAMALGMSSAYRLREIELPLASGAILAGVKTAAVLNVGFATLGALIGAGGYGQPILTGIRLDNTGLILQGALPAAGLAILFQLAFELSERWLVPEGLRLPSGPD